MPGSDYDYVFERHTQDFGRSWLHAHDEYRTAKALSKQSAWRAIMNALQPFGIPHLDMPARNVTAEAG